MTHRNLPISPDPLEVKPVLTAAIRGVLARDPAITTPCLLFDLDRLDRQIDLWFDAMPSVQPHFAIKACDALPILEHFRDRGVAFDAATGGELETLSRLGVSGDKIVMTHPIRSQNDLETIRQHRPRAVVVQRVEEIVKFADAGIPNENYSPLLLIRIALPYSNLNKFGVPCIVPTERSDGLGMTTVFDYRPLKQIFTAARQLERERHVRFGGYGFAGHVGTNTTSPTNYQHLLATFRLLGQELRHRTGIRVNFFDIGRGYCDELHASRAGIVQRDLLAGISRAVERFRLDYGDDVEVIAEPGRFLIADSGAVVARAKIVTDSYFRSVAGTELFEKHKVIHLDDGVYGNLMGQIHDERVYEPIPFRRNASDTMTGPPIPCILWGPTCDSFDRIIPPESYRVPDGLQTGDYFLFDCMGAYSTVTATQFNRTEPTMLVLYRNSTGEVRRFSTKSQ